MNDPDLVVGLAAVLTEAINVTDSRDKNLAVMIANAVNGHAPDGT